MLTVSIEEIDADCVAFIASIFAICVACVESVNCKAEIEVVLFPDVVSRPKID